MLFGMLTDCYRIEKCWSEQEKTLFGYLVFILSKIWYAHSTRQTKLPLVQKFHQAGCKHSRYCQLQAVFKQLEISEQRSATIFDDWNQLKIRRAFLKCNKRTYFGTIRRLTSRLSNFYIIKSPFWPPSGQFFKNLISSMNSGYANTPCTKISSH